MEEDIRKQGMLYLQQQRFGKVGPARLSGALALTMVANLPSASVSSASVLQ